MTFGQRLLAIRKHRNITKDRLAADAGISPACLRNYEYDRNTPSAEALEGLADALGLTMHELWKGVGRCDPSEPEPPSVLVQEIAEHQGGRSAAMPKPCHICFEVDCVNPNTSIWGLTEGESS